MFASIQNQEMPSVFLLLGELQVSHTPSSGAMGMEVYSSSGNAGGEESEHF